MLVAQLADQVLAFLALQLHLVQCRRQLIGHLRELADDAVLLVHAVLQALEADHSDRHQLLVATRTLARHPGRHNKNTHSHSHTATHKRAATQSHA